MMNRLALDFAPHYRPLSFRVGRMAFALSLGLVVVCASRYFELEHQLQGWQSEWQHQQRKLGLRTRVHAADHQGHLREELRFAARVIDRLDTPWDGLFAIVEQSMTEQVSLISIEPDPASREFRLNGEAKDYPAVLEYLQTLRMTPGLQSVYLTSHQINQQDAQQPIRFTLSAQWPGPMPAPSMPVAAVESSS